MDTQMQMQRHVRKWHGHVYSRFSGKKTHTSVTVTYNFRSSGDNPTHVKTDTQTWMLRTSSEVMWMAPLIFLMAKDRHSLPGTELATVSLSFIFLYTVCSSCCFQAASEWDQLPCCVSAAQRGGGDKVHDTHCPLHLEESNLDTHNTHTHTHTNTHTQTKHTCTQSHKHTVKPNQVAISITLLPYTYTCVTYVTRSNRNSPTHVSEGKGQTHPHRNLEPQHQGGLCWVTVLPDVQVLDQLFHLQCRHITTQTEC